MTPSAVTRSSAELRTTFAREPITNNKTKSPGLGIRGKTAAHASATKLFTRRRAPFVGPISNWLFGQWLPVKIALNGAFLMDMDACKK
jgi:hypothetical protein